MKRLILIVMALMLMAGSASAIRSFSRSESAGYSTVNLIVGTADPDSGTVAKKIVFFYGTTVAGIARQDSITTVTNEDTLAVTGLNEGTTYFWYVLVTDSGTAVFEPSDLSGYSFTTTDLTQNTTVSSVGYSTANVIIDSAGLGIGVGIDSARVDFDITDGTTYSASITTVTYPDTFALTGLEEGAIYFVRTIVFLTDSSAADTLTAVSFTTTDLSSSLSILRSNVDSLIVIIDSVDFCPDSLILQWGAGLRGIIANADTNASPNCPDTVIITGIIEGSTISLRVLYFLPDSSAIDTGSVTTYSRASNRFVRQYPPDNVDEFWPDDVFDVYFDWEFDQSSDFYTTGPIAITTQFIRLHLGIDGEDDAATYDSIEVVVWSHEFGDSTAIDTLVALTPDTTTITPLILRMQPSNYSDTSLVLYPPFDWGTHFSISAIMTDSTGFADSTLGIRNVNLVIEEID